MAFRTIGDISRAIYGKLVQKDPAELFVGKTLVVRTKHGKEFNGKIPTAVAKYQAIGTKSAAPNIVTKTANAFKPTEENDLPF
jgi:hypothetical protein